MTEAEKTVEELLSRSTEELMGMSFECVCGRRHEIPMKYLSIKKGAVEEVADRLPEIGISGKGGLVYDRKIEQNVVSGIRQVLSDRGLSLKDYPVGDGKEKIPPEIDRAVSLSKRIETGVDYLVSIGSGVVSDLTKEASDLLGLPYVLIATAPSMNGYTSSMAALTEQGVKKTLLIHPASGIFADISVLQNSPVDMVRSGLGDIVSKSVCNADWKLSEIVKHTYFCPVPFRMTDRSEPLFLGAADEIGARTEHGITVLTDGIMRSGLSMTIIGTSTPSSGAEHLVSHYWDLIALRDHGEKLLHGMQVGVATLMILRLYDYMRNLPVKRVLDMDKLERNFEEVAGINRYIDSTYGGFADGLKQEFSGKYLPWKEKKREVERIVDEWDEIWNALDPYIRPVSPVEIALKKSGSAVHYTDLGKTRDDAIDALVHARLIRGRYTILDMANDLGILREAAGKTVS
jgi:glycerol-1-phosphate dehydrogenase [NAD(P)+]